MCSMELISGSIIHRFNSWDAVSSTFVQHIGAAPDLGGSAAEQRFSGCGPWMACRSYGRELTRCRLLLPTPPTQSY